MPSPSIDVDKLVVRSKVDLHTASVGEEPAISAATGLGIADLLDLLRQRAAGAMAGSQAGLLTRERHIKALTNTVSALVGAMSYDNEDQLELCAEDLRAAAGHLGRIAGRIDVEEILGAIFSRFCIGK